MLRSDFDVQVPAGFDAVCSYDEDDEDKPGDNKPSGYLSVCSRSRTRYGAVPIVRRNRSNISQQLRDLQELRAHSALVQ